MRLSAYRNCVAAVACLLLSAIPSSVSAIGGTAEACVGDCCADGSVSISELIRGVNIALGSQSLDTCFAFDANGDGQVSIAELIQAVNNALNGCPRAAAIEVRSPVADLVIAAGTVAVAIDLPDGTDLDSVVVTLDGDDVTGDLNVRAIRGVRSTGIVEGSLVGVAGGLHVLVARASVDEQVEEATREFRTIALSNGPECEVLNDAECLLPYPSSRFQFPVERDNGNPIEVIVPQSGIPQANGPEIPASLASGIDGFSPTVQILMHFPQGVDPELSDAARLLGPVNPGPPWIDTRTYTGRSLDADSPTILLDVDTGERILHFIENDAHAEGNLPRQALIMRPGESLVPSHRYIVAMRNLRDANGDLVVAEPAFEVLRDGLETDIEAISSRRPQLEAMFTTLEDAGIDRDDLVLAFGFQVQSESHLTGLMLSMRDQAYAWLDSLAGGGPAAATFTVEEVIEHDCSDDGQVVWRDVSGTYQSPLFLDGVPTGGGVQLINGELGGPAVQNGFMDSPFDISIPCGLDDPEGPAAYPIVLGHGLFGTGRSMTRGIPSLAGVLWRIGTTSRAQPIGAGWPAPTWSGWRPKSSALATAACTSSPDFPIGSSRGCSTPWCWRA